MEVPLTYYLALKFTRTLFSDGAPENSRRVVWCSLCKRALDVESWIKIQKHPLITGCNVNFNDTWISTDLNHTSQHDGELQFPQTKWKRQCQRINDSTVAWLTALSHHVDSVGTSRTALLHDLQRCCIMLTVSSHQRLHCCMINSAVASCWQCCQNVLTVWSHQRGLCCMIDSTDWLTPKREVCTQHNLQKATTEKYVVINKSTAVNLYLLRWCVTIFPRFSIWTCKWTEFKWKKKNDTYRLCNPPRTANPGDGSAMQTYTCKLGCNKPFLTRFYLAF
jgi:hypothetical protein